MFASLTSLGQALSHHCTTLKDQERAWGQGYVLALADISIRKWEVSLCNLHQFNVK